MTQSVGNIAAGGMLSSKAETEGKLFILSGRAAFLSPAEMIDKKTKHVYDIRGEDNIYLSLRWFGE